MLSHATAGNPRRITAQEAAGYVQSGMWLDYGSSLGQPDVFDAALAQRASELRGVKIRSCLTVRPRAVLEADPQAEHFHWVSLHFSGYDRRMHDAGLASYLPVNLGEIPDYYRRFIEPVDIVVLKTCPVDANGYFNFSAANMWHEAIIDRAKIVIVEESSGLPYAMGKQAGVHKSRVHFVIEGDNAPATELPNPPPTEVDKAVARLIIPEIEDGSCLQIGIGGMPNAVCSLLKTSSVKNLGIHTEMLTDGIIELYQSGHKIGRASCRERVLMPV